MTLSKWEHLKALMNGEIHFDIARMRVNPSAPSRSTEYQDEETVTMYLHRAVDILTRRHEK